MAIKAFTIAAIAAAMADNTADLKTVDKLSTGKVGATPERAKIEKKPVDVMLVFGEVVGVELGTDKRNGQDWSALKGEFYAVKSDDLDTIYNAGLLFLPAGQALFEKAIMTGQLDKKDRPVFGRAEFGVMCVAVPASNARGYSWEIRNLVDVAAPQETTVAGRLLARMQEKVAKGGPKAIEAPAEAKK